MPNEFERPKEATGLESMSAIASLPREGIQGNQLLRTVRSRTTYFEMLGVLPFIPNAGVAR
jgi:hypothetical protein